AEEEKEGKEELDFSKLTRQEKVVAELVKQGLTNREIGEELCISESTVKKHLSNIFEKLEIGSRRELR
ncbi:MAG: LuxR C-terminal-related transcriptional regulator, partial [Lachnospiraceae bacterium]|nr:LuxR C-terminal-related transcriptional regulator [Lachnospiraceae bacterium]